MAYRELKISDEEKERILNKYISPYEGNVRLQNKSEPTPLNTENLANDSKGITVNNKNEVSHYKNHNINKNDKSK